MAELMSSFIRSIETQAEESFNKSPTSPAGARSVYESALQAKKDDLNRVGSAREREECENDICELYISRAAMEIRLKQKKQAKLVFDEAFKLPYCAKSFRLWKAYINFYIREGRIESARKYFHKAVESVDVAIERKSDA